jgi:hypothetical protein
MSTSPASAGASFSASVVVGSSAAGAAAGFILLLVTGACGSTSVTVGAGLRFLSADSPTVSHSPCPLGLWGRKAESPASSRNSIVSIHNIARQVLDYSTRRVYLLRRSLSDLQLLGDALACHVARPPWRRRQTSLQTSRRIVDEGGIGQSRAAEPRPQLEPLLKCFFIFLV